MERPTAASFEADYGSQKGIPLLSERTNVPFCDAHKDVLTDVQRGHSSDPFVTLLPLENYISCMTRGPNPQKQHPDSSAAPESQPSRDDFGYRTTGYTYSLLESLIWRTRHLADNVVHNDSSSLRRGNPGVFAHDRRNLAHLLLYAH